MPTGSATSARAAPPVRVAVCAGSEIALQGAAAILAPTPGVVLVGRRIVVDGRARGWAAEMGAWDTDVAVVVSGLASGHRWLLAVVSELVRACPGVAVLAVVDRARPGWLPELAEAGAAGIADLATTADELRAALRAVASGRGWVSPAVVEVMAGQAAAGPGAGLSQREFEVLAALAQGMDNARAAAALGVSANTMANHVKSICNKLGASSRLEALTIAVRTGLVDL